MKKIALVLFLISVSSGSYGGDGEKRANIEKLLYLTNADSVVDTIYSQIEKMMAKMSGQLGIKPAEQKYLDSYMAKVTQMMQEEMGWEKMKEPTIQIYMDNFSEKEVADMVNFYESETGRSVTNKMPKILQDSMYLSQDMMKNVFPKIQVFAQELQEELKAARASK